MTWGFVAATVAERHEFGYLINEGGWTIHCGEKRSSEKKAWKARKASDAPGGWDGKGLVYIFIIGGGGRNNGLE